MILGLLLGIGFSFNVGLWLGSHTTEKLYKELIKDYKRDVDYWFNSYMEKCEEHSKLWVKYTKELLK